MGLQQLCTRIEDEAESRAEKSLADARSQAAKIIRNAGASAKETIGIAKAQAGNFVGLEDGERTTAAKIECQKILSDAKDDAAKKALMQVWEHYSRASKGANYAKMLKNQAELALKELALPGASIQCNQADRQTLASAGFKLWPEPIECAGGARASSRDGKVLVDYTLEALFEQKREDLFRQVHSILFADEARPREAGKTIDAKKKSSGIGKSIPAKKRLHKKKGGKR